MASKVEIDRIALIELYVRRELSLDECGSIIGCTHHTVAALLARHGILQRSAYRITVTKEWLEEHYVRQHRSLRDCASLAGYSKFAITKKLKFFEIPIGKSGVPKEPRIRDRNPNWKGGLKKQAYCYKFNEDLRERVRESFGRTCYLCPTTEANNGKKLDVHHADYNKGQGCGHEWNLLPLCIRCHAKTGHYRHYYFNLLSNYWCMNPEIHFNCAIYPFDVHRRYNAAKERQKECRKEH